MTALSLLAPSPAADRIAAAMRDLPSRLRWPGTVGFEDYTQTPETEAMGAKLVVDGSEWTIRCNRADVLIGTTFRDDPTLSLVAAVDVSWSPALDAETGALYAVPAFGGIEVIDGPGSLDDLCATVGFGRRKVIDVPARPDPVEVSINGTPVSVEAAPGVTPKQFEKALASPKFIDWVASVDPGLAVKRVMIQSVDLFGPNVGFLKIVADVSKDGTFVPGISFIRGDSVGILVVLVCDDREYLLLTVQPRSSVGSSGFVEIPAGMMDGSGNFVGQAAKELGEEAGLRITEGDLTDLSTAIARTEEEFNAPVSYALSPGGCDECMRFFVHRKNVTRAELTALEGKATGLLEEGEVITLKVVRLNDRVRRIPDGKTQIAVGLYQEIRTLEMLGPQILPTR